MVLAPLPRADAEAAFKTGIEKTPVVEAALPGQGDDLGLRVAQQGNHFEQAHLHAERANRKPKMFLEEAVQMPLAATEPAGQFFPREVQDFFHGQLLENIGHPRVGALIAGERRL